MPRQQGIAQEPASIVMLAIIGNETVDNWQQVTNSGTRIMEKIIVHAKFHTGHRQIGYPGKCRVRPGHTWRGTITVRADEFRAMTSTCRSISAT